MSTPIKSPENAWVKRFLRALAEHDEEIVIEGPKQVGDALASGWGAIAVAVTGDGPPDIGMSGHTAFEERTLPPTARRVSVDRKIFRKISQTETAQGVVGLFHRPSTSVEAILSDMKRPVVVLDRVQDPGNVGAIVRLAAAFDAAGVVILGGSADPYGPKAIRASAGSILNVSVSTCTADKLIELAGASNRPLLSADARGGEIGHIPRNAVIVMGSEGDGVSPAILERSRRVAIPMSERVESLNVAAAAAILLARAFERH